MTKENKVSISIVIYKSQETILDCLEPLTEGLIDESFEIILVDNCSPDESLQKINSFPQADKLTIVKAKENLGFYQKVNQQRRN